MTDHSQSPHLSRSAMSSRLISAFPATGKTTYANGHRDTVVDSDSSAFSWKWTSFDVRERHPHWPDNYLTHIKSNLYDGKTVLVSSHAEVREMLADAGIPFTLVYPQPELRVEYLVRMAQRGSPLALIEMIDRNWLVWIDEMLAQRGCEHLILGKGEYLGDVLSEAALLEQGGQR